MQRNQHYLTLDALRGVAAFAVMIYHQQQAALMGHGYLAVDFFFLLSGFVISNAYEAKLLSNMRFTRFAMVRIARLYPLLIGATLISAAYMAMSSVRRGQDLGWLSLLPAALLGLPDPSRTFAPDPFPLLPVVWSLFFELIANFVYAACADWLRTRRLAIVIFLNGLLLLFAVYHHGNGELGNTYATLWAGLPRVSFSFFAGVLLFRFQSAGRLFGLTVSPFLLAAVLFAVLSVPRNVPWIYDGGCIFVIFPLILIGAIRNQPSASWRSVARVSADLSYPLYLLHLPLLLWLGFVLSHFGVAGTTQQFFALLAIPALAYTSDVLFDRPLQRFLKGKIASVGSQAIGGAGTRAL